MSELRDKIIDLLLNKAALKQDVAELCEQKFTKMKDSIRKEIELFAETIDDSRIRLRVKEKSKYVHHLFIGSDILVFQLHSNVFRLDSDNEVWNSSEEYLNENGANSYVGVINVYNFLAESYEQNRLNDEGYLIGRIFINHEEQFLIEAKGRLNSIESKFGKQKLSDEIICEFVQKSMLDAIEFDLISPPYDMMERATVIQVQAISNELQISTGKRLGFKFSNEDHKIT